MWSRIPDGLRPRAMLLLGLALVASLALVFLAMRQEERSELADTDARMVLWSRLLREQETRTLIDLHAMLTELARPGWLEAITPAQATAVLRQHLAEVHALGGLAAIDPHGRVFADTDGLLPHDVRNTTWFRHALSAREFTVDDDRAHDGGRGVWTRCAMPILDARGGVVAVLCATLDPERFREALAQMPRPQRLHLLVVDERGAVLAEQPMRARPDSVLWSLRPSMAGLWTQELAGRDGVRQRYAFTTIEGARLRTTYLGVGTTRADVIGDVHATFLRIGILLAAVLLVAMLVFWRGLDRLVLARVRALHRATDRLRHGDLAARTGPHHGAGELGLLSRDFDAMAETLQWHSELREHTERRLRLSEARQRAVFEAALDAILVFDDRGRLLECNRVGRELFGLGALRPDHRLEELFALPDGAGTTATLDRDRRFETQARRLDGTEFPAEVCIAPIRNQDAPGLRVAILRDITDRRRAQQALEAELHRDDLTGLLNRRGFRAAAETQLKLAARAGFHVVVVAVDVDDLKTINDRFGHEAGDRALIEVAAALHDSFRDSDAIARMGGDEFVVLATESGTYGVEHTIERFLMRLAARDVHLHNPWRLSASVGWTRHAPDVRTRLETLLAQADQAMYERKRAGHLGRGARHVPEPHAGSTHPGQAAGAA